jgi:hypothetical protein
MAWRIVAGRLRSAASAGAAFAVGKDDLATDEARPPGPGNDDPTRPGCLPISDAIPTLPCICNSHPRSEVLSRIPIPKISPSEPREGSRMSGDRIRAEFNARLDALLARADRLVAARQSELAHWEAKLADELARKRRPRMWSGTAQSSRPSSRCCRGGTVKIRQPERRGEAQAGFRTSHYEHCVPLRPLARMIAASRLETGAFHASTSGS